MHNFYPTSPVLCNPLQLFPAQARFKAVCAMSHHVCLKELVAGTVWNMATCSQDQFSMSADELLPKCVTTVTDQLCKNNLTPFSLFITVVMQEMTMWTGRPTSDMKIILL